MIPDFKDLAQIYQQRALESLSKEDLAHAKRYRIAAELEAVLRECREVIEEAQTYCEGPQWSPSMAHECGTAIAKIDEALNGKE